MTHEAEVTGIGVSIGDEGKTVPAVVLKAQGKLIPIFISPNQAQSMQLAIEDVPFERPLTHDLLVEMITDFGGAFDRVRIDDLFDDTFFAKIDAELYNGGEPRQFVFDARPSDAIAIALRVDCPIFVTDDVIDASGRESDELYVGPDVEPEIDQDADPEEFFE